MYLCTDFTCKQDEMELWNKFVFNVRCPKVIVPIGTLIEQKLPISIYVLLFLIDHNCEDLAFFYNENVMYVSREELEYAYLNGWLTKKEGHMPLILRNVLPTMKFRDITMSTEPIMWIDEWFDLWPNGIKSGTYYVKTDKVGCLKKMERFIRLNPQYSKDIIISATKNYIRRLEIDNYKYMKLAPYFIEKDGISMLAGECEQTLNNKDKIHIDGDGFGEVEFT